MRNSLVCGVGNNDADYVVVLRKEKESSEGKRVREVIWRCPYYSKWSSVLSRCYSKKTLAKNTSYIGCSVSEEWLTFSNFKAWMIQQDWKGLHLDKDILQEGNKVYSPETCVFVTRQTNNFITDRAAYKGNLPTGVSIHKQSGKFTSRCNNPFNDKYEHLGLFLCEKEAGLAWLKRKLELAYLLSEIQQDKRVGEALIRRYKYYNQEIIY